jgi:hypothetical protein
MLEGSSDQHPAAPPVKYVEFVDANDHTKKRSTMIVQPGKGQEWTPRGCGTRSAMAGIPEKGLPGDSDKFRDTVGLFTSPGLSTVLPYEAMGDQEYLRELECTDDLVKGHAKAKVMSGVCVCGDNCNLTVAPIAKIPAQQWSAVACGAPFGIRSSTNKTRPSF